MNVCLQSAANRSWKKCSYFSMMKKIKQHKKSLKIPKGLPEAAQQNNNHQHAAKSTSTSAIEMRKN